MSPPKSHAMIEVRWLGSIESKAVFATKHIRQGTRITAEAPLIIVPPSAEDKELSTVYDEIYKLPENNVAKIAELSVRPIIRDRAKKDHVLHQDVWRFYKGKKWMDITGATLKGKRLHKAIMKAIDLFTIFRVNSLYLGPEGKYGSGLFSLYGQMNHSCIPNVHGSWNPALKQLTIHAIQDINAGDQIYVDYTGNALAAYECGASKDSNFSTVHKIPRLLSPIEAFRAAEELAYLMKRQNLRGIGLCRALRECSKYALAKGDRHRAVTYAHEELKLEKSLIGTDTGHLEDGLQGARYWFQFLVSARN
ncbi:SET domain-containing protein [Hypoxylon sp. FL1150]|nr:SET domain-containing protein [Hypoxylon sp. FL1150]